MQGVMVGAGGRASTGENGMFVREQKALLGREKVR